MQSFVGLTLRFRVKIIPSSDFKARGFWVYIGYYSRLTSQLLANSLLTWNFRTFSSEKRTALAGYTCQKLFTFQFL